MVWIMIILVRRFLSVVFVTLVQRLAVQSVAYEKMLLGALFLQSQRTCWSEGHTMIPFLNPLDRLFILVSQRLWIITSASWDEFLRRASYRLHLSTALL